MMALAAMTVHDYDDDDDEVDDDDDDHDDQDDFLLASHPSCYNMNIALDMRLILIALHLTGLLAHSHGINVI